MRTSAIVSALFAIGALSAPLAPKELEKRELVVDVVVHTITKTITIGGSGPTPEAKAGTDNNGVSQFIHRPQRRPRPRPSSSKPAEQPPAPTPTPTPSPTTSEATQPSVVPPKQPSTPPTPPSSGNDGSPKSGGVSLLTTANKYRKNVKFTWSSTLANNAAKAASDGKGQMKHEMNPGTFGQVIAPGTVEWGSGFNTAKAQGDSPFEVTYAAWLCEVPGDAILQGPPNQCQIVKDVFNMRYSGTAHHDILTSEKYTKIGCAHFPYPDGPHGAQDSGLWYCDVA